MSVRISRARGASACGGVRVDIAGANMSRARGGANRRGASGRAASDTAPPAAASPSAVLEAVAQNPGLRGVHVVLRQLIEKDVAATPQPRLREHMEQAFSSMLQGKGPSFSELRGALTPPTPSRA